MGSPNAAGPTPRRIYDSGAQLERTALAWNRTLLAFAVNGALLVRVGHSIGIWAAVAGLCTLIGTLICWWLVSRHYRRLAGRPAPGVLLHGPVASVVALGSAGLGAAALLVVLFHPVR